jgi:hypothetical protein
MLNPHPNVIWAPGIGLIGVGGDKVSASMAADIAYQNIKVIMTGENLSGYFPIGEKDQFDIEYWSLEQAKILKSFPSLIKGKTIIITGAGGAIGRATAIETAAVKAGDKLNSMFNETVGRHRFAKSLATPVTN